MSHPLRGPVPSLGTAMASSIGIVASYAVGRLTWKAVADVATTANVTIASDLNAGDTIDGITLVAGMRVLVWKQTAQAENGIYVVDSSPFRAIDFDDSGEIVGARVAVTAGTANGGKVFRNTNTTAITVDTDAITFVVDSIGAPGGIDTGGATSGDVLVFDGSGFVVRASGRHAHVVGEPFVGDASQTVFYLANEAELDTVAAYDKDGHRVSITQDTTELDKITFASAPAAGTGWLDYLPALI